MTSIPEDEVIEVMNLLYMMKDMGYKEDEEWQYDKYREISEILSAIGQRDFEQMQ